MSENLSDFFWNPKSGRFERMSRRGRWNIKFPKAPKPTVRKSPKVTPSLIVGTAGFLGGYYIGTKIYKYAEKPNNKIQEAFDFFQGTGRYKRNSAPVSSGGKEIQAPEYPFEGGQTNASYRWRVTYEVYVGSGNIRREYTVTYPYQISGPVSNFHFKDYTWNQNIWYPLAIYWLSNNQEVNYPVQQEYRVRKKPTILSVELWRLDGTSKQNDIAQGGNPPPIVQNIVTNNVTNNTTNINNNYSNSTPTGSLSGNSEKTPIGTNKTKTGQGDKNGTEEKAPTKSNQGNEREGKEQKEEREKKRSPEFVPIGVPYNAEGEPVEKTTTKNLLENLPLAVAPVTSKSGSSGSSTSLSGEGNTIKKEEKVPVTNNKTEKENTKGEPQTNDGQCCTPPLIPEINTRLNGIQGLVDALDLTLLQTINNKLGDQLYGGISGYFKKAWESTAIDKAINAMNLFLTLHNAAMLSRNLTESVDVLIGNSLSLIGIKNHEGNPIDFSAVIGNAVENFLKSLLGEATYTGVNNNWKKLNTIYQSAVNIMDNLQNIYAGITEAIETGAKYTGKIGNALKRAGVVFEDAYDWMDENIRARTGRMGQIQKVIDGIQTAQEVTDDLTSITSNIQEVTESVGQITTEINNIKAAVNTGESEKESTETTGKTNSQSADINNSDRIPPSPS